MAAFGAGELAAATGAGHRAPDGSMVIRSQQGESRES